MVERWQTDIGAEAWLILMAIAPDACLGSKPDSNGTVQNVRTT